MVIPGSPARQRRAGQARSDRAVMGAELQSGLLSAVLGHRGNERGGGCGSRIAEEYHLSELMPDIPIWLSRVQAGGNQHSHCRDTAVTEVGGTK